MFFSWWGGDGRAFLSYADKGGQGGRRRRPITIFTVGQRLALLSLAIHFFVPHHDDMASRLGVAGGFVLSPLLSYWISAASDRADHPQLLELHFTGTPLAGFPPTSGSSFQFPAQASPFAPHTWGFSGFCCGLPGGAHPC